MYKGYPICFEEGETVSVFRLKLEPLEEIRLHEEILPDAFEKICRSICEEKVLQDPIFIDEDSKVILDGMHRAAALKMLKKGKCKDLLKCAGCKKNFEGLEYILCCSVDYINTDAVKLKKWYRGVQWHTDVSNPLEDVLELVKSNHEVQERSDDSLQDNDFAILTDGKKYFSLLGTFSSALDKYKALRDVEKLIEKHGGTVKYYPDEKAYDLLKEGKFSILIVTPDIRKEDVQTFSTKGCPLKGEIFPPKSTRHVFPTRPLKINFPLELLNEEEYQIRQEQLKVFLRRKRRLTVRGEVEQYLEEHKILFGEPAELKEPKENAYLWICEFPLEFYEIKYDVDEFTEEVSALLIKNNMELDYSALIHETNRLILIISDVKDEITTENLITSLIKTHFPDYGMKNLFGEREDHTPRWIIPMEDFTPSRAYFERDERLLRELVKTHGLLKLCNGAFQAVEKEKIEELRDYSSEDLLVLFALHVLKKASRSKVFEYLHEDMDDHELVFSRIDDLIAKKLIQKEDILYLSEKGKEVKNNARAIRKEVINLVRERSTDRFSELLKDIDSNISNVIRPDGRKDKFQIGSIMESLVFTDIGWKKVIDILDGVADEFEGGDFVSSDELTSFIQKCLKKKHPLGNESFRYDYFINSRDHIFLEDEKVVSLSRKYIEKRLNRFLPPFLEMDAKQKSTLSNMVYEGIRLLTIPLIKELYERERIVFQKEFFSQIEEFLVYQAVPILKKLKNKTEKEVVTVLSASLEKARTNAELSSELLDRKDTEFLKYYILTMNNLTESLCISLGKVPFSNVFRRLGQLAQHAKEDAKNPSSKAMFFTVDDYGRFLRRINLLFRRSTSLLDKWRSLYREYHGEPPFDKYSPGWHKHLTDVAALIERCLNALDR